MDDLAAGQGPAPSPVQRQLAINRLIAVAVVTALLPLLWPIVQAPAVLVGALALMWCVAVLEVAGFPIPGFVAERRQTLVSLADSACLLLGILATGGYDSPFYVAAYAQLFSLAFSGDSRHAALTGTLYVAAFFALGVHQDRIAGNLPEFLFREAMLALSTLIGLTLTREVARQVAARAKAEEKLAVESRLAALEQQLVIADRLAAVGTLAAGMAHEINNPLTYVIANVDLCEEAIRNLEGEMPPESLAALRKALAGAALGGERVRQIVRDLRIFSRADSDVLGPVDVQRVADSAIDMARSAIRQRARLEKDYREVPPVLATEGRLGQILINLLVNASQALPDAPGRDDEIRVAIGPAPDGRVAVEVGDTGEGIPPERLGRVFDPFFTTKPPGTGTGLGLFVCHGIVKGLGGEIRIESTVGQGTRVQVLLPACVPEAGG